MEEMIPVSTLPDQLPITLHTLISVSASATNPSRPTLLLLHFWGGSNRTFSHLITELYNEYNIIAPSLRGWGQSSKPKDPGAYRISDYVDDISGLLAYLQEHRPELLRTGIVIAGHSMGGKIAQVLLTRTEVTDLVKRLILIAPAPARAFQLPEEMREVQVQAYSSRESAKGAVENVLLGNAASVSEREITALVEDAVSGSSGAKAAWPLYGMSEDFEGAVRNAVLDWPRGKLRVLVVVGGLDQVEPESSVRERTVRMLEDAGALVTVSMLEGIGHLIPVEAPHELAAEMRAFISGLA